MASGLVAELYAKHQNSPQPSSQAVCAVLGASLEVLQAEGLEASPASLFAAVMSSLEKPDGKGPPEICTALCTILNACCTRLPDSLVRSKFVNCSKIILEIMRMHEQQASLMRQAVEALGLVTSAMDPNSWVHATEPFNRLLGLSFDSRPKVRRAAQQALANVFAAIQGQPVLSNASDTLVQVSQQILPGPEAALTKSRGKKNVQQHNNVIVQKALTDALHALNLLKLVLPLATEKVVTQIASMLPKLFAVGHTVLSCQAGETLSALCNSSTSKIRADHLGPLLSKFCSMDQMWQTRDTDVQLTLLKLVESGYTRLYALDTKIALSELEEGFSRVFTALSLPHDGTRRAAQLVLKNLIHSYIEGSTVEEAKQLRQIFRIVEQGLDVAHQDTLISVLPVVEELFENVNASHATVVIEIIEGTGSICSLAQQNNEEEEGEEDELRGIIKAANSAMGAAIRKLGPEVILTVLPLRLQAKEGQGNNLWLLPLLRQYVGNTSLGFWGKAMLPLARSLVESASNLTAGSEQQIQAVQLKVLEQQIWNLLPSFCIWPTDLASAFSEHAQTLGKAFQNRPDLQPTICLALRRLCTQAKVASQEQGSVEGSRSAFIPQDLDDEEEDEMLANDFSDIPSHYSELVAERDLQALRGFAKNWMPLLFNAFVEAKPGYRSHLAGAISAYASVSDPSVLESFFKTIVKKLIKTLGGKSKTSESIEEGEGTEKRCTFMELALCLASGLPRSAIQVLQKIASPASQEKDQAIQKRAYRLLAYILEERKDYTHEHFQEVLDNLLLGVASSMSAAKRYRLRCLKAAVLMMQGPNPPSLVLNEEEMGLTIEAEKKQQVTSLLVGEIILCIKEVNKKTRIAAYELLVSLAHTMHETNPPPFQGISDAAMGENEGQSRGGLNDLFNMVLAGLIGATPHMISASIMALARLLYEFSSHLQVAAPELLPVVLSLFRSKAREIIKSVLGFVKVCVMKLPVEVLQQNLEAILEGILIWSEDSKNKFRLKVRVIVERLVRRLDYETVAEHLPEGDRKLLTHIRKEQQRKAKKGQSEAGSEADIEDEVTVVRSRNGKQIANRSEWGHSRVFSSDEDELETKSKKTARSSKRPVANGKANLNKAKGKLAGLRLSNQEDDEPMDLLESANFRSMERQAAGQGRPSTEPDFPMDGARMVINEEAPTKKSKRKRGGGIDTAASDDSDFDDLHHIRGATAALRLDGQSGAASLAGKSGFKSDAKTQGAKTMSGKTFAGRSAGGKSKQSERQGKEHSGKRYAASKQGAGGDVKGKSKHSPYAYWPLDRKMINRRTGKKVEAAKGLASVLQTSQGSLKGSKAKRQKR